MSAFHDTFAERLNDSYADVADLDDADDDRHGCSCHIGAPCQHCEECTECAEENEGL